MNATSPRHLSHNRDGAANPRRHRSHRRHRMQRGAIAALAGLLLAACGAKVSGVYSGKNTGMLDQIEFRDDGKVELTFMGSVQEGRYVVEDGRVKISHAGGGTQVFRIDDKGCLDGGGMLGRYCKV